MNRKWNEKLSTARTTILVTLKRLINLSNAGNSSTTSRYQRSSSSNIFPRLKNKVFADFSHPRCCHCPPKERKNETSKKSFHQNPNFPFSKCHQWPRVALCDFVLLLFFSLMHSEDKLAEHQAEDGHCESGDDPDDRHLLLLAELRWWIRIRNEFGWWCWCWAGV